MKDNGKRKAIKGWERARDLAPASQLTERNATV